MVWVPDRSHLRGAGFPNDVVDHGSGDIVAIDTEMDRSAETWDLLGPIEVRSEEMPIMAREQFSTLILGGRRC